MRALLTARAGRLGVIAVIALTVGGVAYATIPDSNGVIHGCYTTMFNQGQLRVIDTDKGQACKPGEQALDWNQEGVQGPSGPSGARGPSNGFSRFHDDEIAADTLDAPRLLELPVPAGSFVTTGTAIVRNAGAGVAAVRCRTMHPSGDFDDAVASLAPIGQAGDRQTLAMNPVGFATAPGVIWLDCVDSGVGADVRVSWMKISTVQVEALTNTPG